MKKEITLDEWIYHYAVDDGKYQIVDTFLEAVFKKCDTLVVKRSSPIIKKLWSICSECYYWPPPKLIVAKYLIQYFIKNLDKFKFILTEKKIPENVVNDLPNKDIYIVETALNTRSRIIVTTDSGLIESVKRNKDSLGIKIYHVDEFLKEYLQ